jgi:hypothetical protein
VGNTINTTYSHLHGKSREKFYNLPYIGDFHLKCCILKENTKNNISGRNIASLPFVCLRDRQADPPWINTDYAKE